jgi:hypothetical protein
MIKVWCQYPINELKENKLISVGKNKLNVLVKVSTVRLEIK